MLAKVIWLRPSGRASTVVGMLLMAVALATAACSRKIGDGCTSGADCDPSGGTRTCDLSQPGGYCLIEGCDARSCPEDSFCARFFPDIFVSKPCSAGCDPAEICIGSDADGVCVRRSLERRICVQSCGGDGDCRGGYVCRPTEQDGVLALTVNPITTPPRFCRPAP